MAPSVATQCVRSAFRPRTTPSLCHRSFFQSSCIFRVPCSVPSMQNAWGMFEPAPGNHLTEPAAFLWCKKKIVQKVRTEFHMERKTANGTVESAGYIKPPRSGLTKPLPQTPHTPGGRGRFSWEFSDGTRAFQAPARACAACRFHPSYAPPIVCLIT